MNQYSAILDIGSSKIICMICSAAHRDGLAIHGAGICEYKGYRHGSFVDERALCDAVVEAIHAAEVEAKRRVRDIAVGVPAPFSFLHVNDCVVDINGARITDDDVEELLNISLDFEHPKGYELVHSTPVAFRIDGMEKAENPVGDVGRKLSARVSHVFVRSDFKKLVDEALESIELEADIYVSVPLATGLFLIPQRERMNKALLIDVGHTHTDVCLLRNAALADMRTLDIGGMHFSNDLAYGLQIPAAVAENVKRRYVYSLDYQDTIDIIRIPDSQALRVEHEVVQFILEERTKELADLIAEASHSMGATIEPGLPIYLTGGGISLMRGSCEFLERYYGVPVEVKMPWMPRLSSPNYASAYGVMDFVLRADGGEGAPLPKRETKNNKWMKKLIDFFTK